MFDRLGAKMRTAIQEVGKPGTFPGYPAPHTFICVTCGAVHENNGGFCVEERPDSIAIPIETLRGLELAAKDSGLSQDEVAARLISIGLYALGRGAWREESDLYELWEALETQRMAWERLAADPRDLAREEKARHAAAATAS